MTEDSPNTPSSTKEDARVAVWDLRKKQMFGTQMFAELYETQNKFRFPGPAKFPQLNLAHTIFFVDISSKSLETGPLCKFF